MRSLIASATFAFLAFFLFGCGSGRMGVGGVTVWSFSDAEIRLTNNFAWNGQRTYVTDPVISNGRFFPQNRHGTLVSPQVWTGETIGGEIGYLGRYGGEIYVSAKVYSGDGLYLGLVRDRFSVYRNRDEYESICIEWVVDGRNFEPVDSWSP